MKAISISKNKPGKTPIIEFKKNLFLKLESKNPTGSYKDRETVYLLNKAKEIGINKIEVVSSGNAALSASYFGKLFGFKVKCHIPKHTSIAKKKVLHSFGAQVIEHKGIYEDIYHKISKNPSSYWNITPGMNKFCGFGAKSISYELYDQLGIPDFIIVPCGNGTNLAAIWKGFKELKQQKNLLHMPKMMCVQVKDAAPIKTAYDKKKDFIILDNIPDSIAEGIVAAESYSSKKAVLALKESKGLAVEVSEAEIFSSYDFCLSNSIDCEPTSATVFAALNKLCLPKSKKIVMIITGSDNKELIYDV